MLEGEGCRAEGEKREKKKWDNCNNINNKIHLKKIILREYHLAKPN